MRTAILMALAEAVGWSIIGTIFVEMVRKSFAFNKDQTALVAFAVISVIAAGLTWRNRRKRW